MAEREMFQLKTPENSEIFVKNSEVKFNQAINEMISLESERIPGRRINSAEIGAIAGKSFVRYIASKYDRPETIQSITQEVKSLLPKDIAEEFIAGFFSEYAVAQALTVELGREVYYSTPQEDKIRQADWIVKEPEDLREIYLQVKTLPAIDPDISKLAFTVESEWDIEDMAEVLYSLKYHKPVSVGHYIKGAEAMLRHNQDNDCRLAYLFVPPLEVNPHTGTITNKAFISELDNFFGELLP